MLIRFTVFMLSASLLLTSCTEPAPPTYTSFDDYPVYTGNDLGYTYLPQRTTFRLWSPAVSAAQVHLYNEGIGGTPYATLAMERKKDGVWEGVYPGDGLNSYYTYQVEHEGKWLEEAPDLYAIATGVNGLRAQIIDPGETFPENWADDTRPPLAAPTDMVIYELHIRDISIDPASGIQHKGKFLGLSETGTHTPGGSTTGIDHLVELGVTHVHLLPSFDFRSLDETLPDAARGYNWGYDPHLYNVPEGSYATDATDGRARVREFRQMVQALHRAGIRVIMDVVYNHTGATENSVFNRLVPGYYYRFRDDGTYSDAAACGNETASERPMVRQFIVNSVRYWAEQYHVDGFRFDLMGIHDITTMNEVSKALKAIDPTIFVYGEGWTAGDSPLPVEQRAIKANVPKLTSVAAFSDEIRDAIKGHVFTPAARGFISGQDSLEQSIRFGVVAGTQHPQIDYAAVNYTDTAWAPQPSQCIVYTSCHDNHTLWDRLINSIGTATETERIQMQALGLGIVLTAQGVPFLHAGSDFCRTKYGVENSYNQPDSINRIDWTRKETYRPVFDFTRQMIALRQAHPAFRMPTTEAIAANLQFMEGLPPKVVAYTLNGAAAGDGWSKIAVYYNGSRNAQRVAKPVGTWQVAVRGMQVDTEGLLGEEKNETVTLAPASMLVLWQ